MYYIGEEAGVVSSLWVTEGHHGRYQQVTLKVAPVGDHRDCHGITGVSMSICLE